MGRGNIYQVDREIDAITDGYFGIGDLIGELCAEKKIPFKPAVSAEDIMTTDVKLLTLDHTTAAFLRLMKEYNVRHALIVDSPNEGEREAFFVGVVSERDVLRLTSPQARYVETKRRIDRRALKQLLTQIVVRKPKYVSPETALQDIISILLGNHFDMLPVISGSKPVGVITTADLLKVFIEFCDMIYKIYPDLKNKARPGKSRSFRSPGKKLLSAWVWQSVKQIMPEQVISLEQNETIRTAIEIMKQKRFRHLPITDSGQKLIGIVSDRDVLRQLPFAGRRSPIPSQQFREHLFSVAPEEPVLDMPLGQIMTKKIRHIPTNCSIHEAAKIMRELRVNCLPVVTKAKKIRGIITNTNIIQILASAYETNQFCLA
ncbi:CBS domain-containing protein [Planctomycetota bacterium]